MKKILIPILAVAVFASCNNTPEGAESHTTDTQATASAGATDVSYNVDSATSSLGWEGYGVGKQHTGNLALNNGSFTVNNGIISSGNFEININSLTNADVPADQGKDKLVGHLLSPDFFDGAKYPTATFSLTKCEALTGDSTATHTISGNLKLKDSTKNVSFPAKISISDAAVTANAKFKINRTDWGMSYGNDKSLKDKFIGPEVGITLNINAKK